MSNEEKQPFINYLEGLGEDRKALAALRRGLGQTGGMAPEMYPYVVPWLPQDVYPWKENVYYLIAALYGYHPVSSNYGNMGDHFRQMRDPNPDHNSALERRFTNLLATHPDDMGFHLRQVVSYLKSKDVAVNWEQLMQDLLRWEDPERRGWVQKTWARKFWGEYSE